MSATQKNYNIRFGIEIELISPYTISEFVNIFNKTAHQFLLQIKVIKDGEDGEDKYWAVKGDSSIKFLTKDIDDPTVFPTKIPQHKFPQQKFLSGSSDVAYRKGEQMFLPVEMSEAKLIDRKPTFEVGDENIKFLKASHGSTLELVSPPLDFTDVNIDQVRWVINILKRMRMKVNASAGIHVHVSHNAMDLFNFVSMLMDVDEKMIKELWPTRFNTHYTKAKTVIVDAVKHYLSKLFDKSKIQTITSSDLTNILNIANEIENRYYGLNSHAFKAHKTIEFRYAASELRADKVIGWVNYIRDIVYKAIDKKEIKIGDYTIIKDEHGSLSVKSDIHNDTIFSNHLIDLFSRKENIELGMKEFLKRKEIREKFDLYNSIKYFDKEISKNISSREIYSGIKFTDLNSAVLFFRELSKSNFFNDNKDLLSFIEDVCYYASTIDYIIKELINEKVFSLNEIIKTNSGIKDIIKSVNDSVINEMNDKDFLELLDFISDNYIDVIADHILFKCNDKQFSLICNNKKYSYDALVDSSDENFLLNNGLKLYKKSNDYINIFNQNNIQRLYENYYSNFKQIIEFLTNGNNELSTILIDNIDLSSDEYDLIKIKNHLVRSLTGYDFDMSKTNAKNINKLYSKFEKLPEEDLKDFKIINDILNDTISFNDIVEGGDDFTNLSINVEKNLDFLSTKKLGLFIALVNSNEIYRRRDDFKKYLDDSARRKETVDALNSYLKVVNLKPYALFKMIFDIALFLNVEEIIKQENFNRIVLNDNEIYDIFSLFKGLFDWPKMKENAIKIFDMLVGSIKNRKAIIDYYMNLYLLNNVLNYDDQNFLGQLLQEHVDIFIRKNDNLIDYKDMANTLYEKLFTNRRTNNNVKKIINLFKEDDSSDDIINIKRLKANLVEKINENFSTFIFDFTRIFSDDSELLKEGFREFVQFFGYDQFPMIKFISNLPEVDNEVLKKIIQELSAKNETTIYGIETYFKDLSSMHSLTLTFVYNIGKPLLLPFINALYNSGNSRLEMAALRIPLRYYDTQLPDIDFIEGLKNISKKLCEEFLRYYVLDNSNSKLFIIEHYNELEKMDVLRYVNKHNSVASAKKIVNSNFTKLKINKTYKALDDESDEFEYVVYFTTIVTHKTLGDIKCLVTMSQLRRGLSKTIIVSFSGNKDFVEPVKNFGSSHYELSTKDFHSIAYNNLYDMISEEEVDLYVQIVMTAYQTAVGNLSQSKEFKKEIVLNDDFEEEKKELKENKVKKKEIEIVDYNKEFKNLMLTEGVKKAKLFLMKNKNKINDRKLVSIINRMGI